MNIFTCADARELLQEHHDQGLSAPARLQAHLDDCPSCRKFNQFLDELGVHLRAEIDAVTGEPGAPAVHKLTVQARSRRLKKTIRRAVSGLAAALVLTFGVTLGSRLIREAETRQYVSRETQLFVDDLFADSMLEGIELVSFTGWEAE